MGVKVAATCFQWSHPIIRHSPSSSQALASAISSPSSSKRRCRSDSSAGPLVCRYSVQRLDGWAPLFGSSPSTTKLTRSPSCEYPKTRRAHTMKRACSASLDSFDDEDFSQKMVEMSIKFQHSGDDQDADADANTRSTNSDGVDSKSGYSEDSFSFSPNQTGFFLRDTFEPPWDNIREAAMDWSDQIERKANSVEIPLSLRIIKKKLLWEDGFREAGETACCSVKKAFSSMVFIIRELHCYSLQMRELLFTEDLQGILARVQKEMHASFVWLFQQVFSHTPTLMVYVMILLANFTVHSMSTNVAIASYPQPASTVEIVSVVEVEDQMNQTFDSSTVKTFSVSSSSGKSTSVGGNIGGGGGNFRLVGNGTEGDGRSDRLDQFRTVVPDGASQLSSMGATGEAESVSGEVNRVEDELGLWNSIVEEAAQMQASLRDESLDHETMKNFVSPITATFEPDDYSDYFRTELLYRIGLSQEPTNALLLANFAQFLYLVAHDNDRAEEYFKKAVRVDPPDAEAYSNYATFLWKVKKDLWAAEETFLEAISADPTNTYHAANYANFLWNTGGEDTCYPLGSSDNYYTNNNNNNNIQEV